MKRTLPLDASARRPLSRWLWPLILASILPVACSEPEPIAGDVYQVIPQSCSGEIHVRATAMAVSPDLVATAAHSFERAAGAVLRDVVGQEVAAEVVYADFSKDIALLRVDPPNTAVFSAAEPEDGANVRLVSYDSSETGPVVKDGVVLRTVMVTLDGEGRRRAVELEADIERGDSGGPVVDGDGAALGMVFASSRSGRTGWAVTFDELGAAIDALKAGAEPSLPVECD